MRQFWLTDDHGERWDLSAYGGSPFVNARNLGSKKDITYWQGKRVFSKMYERSSLATAYGTIIFKDGTFEQFESYIGASEYHWLWCKRDGCTARRCKVIVSIDERSEDDSNCVQCSVSMDRLTPWRDDDVTETKAVSESSAYSLSAYFEFVNKGDIESPLYISIENTGTNDFTEISGRISLYRTSAPAVLYSDSYLKVSSTLETSLLFEMDADPEDQRIDIGGVVAYPMMDFTKDNFLFAKPGNCRLSMQAILSTNTSMAGKMTVTVRHHSEWSEA